MTVKTTNKRRLTDEEIRLRDRAESLMCKATGVLNCFGMVQRQLYRKNPITDRWYPVERMYDIVSSIASKKSNGGIGEFVNRFNEDYKKWMESDARESFSETTPEIMEIMNGIIEKHRG